DLATTFEIRLNTDFGGYWDSGFLFDRQVYPQVCFDLMTSDDLAKARNLIFAFRGSVFKSAKWRDYFSQFDWYKPDVGFAERFLSDTEAANVGAIRAAEASRKPVSESEPSASSTGEP
ncbi:MAG: YARHG domain-containing protein, partial [Terriglobales bacterium]